VLPASSRTGAAPTTCRSYRYAGPLNSERRQEQRREKQLIDRATAFIRNKDFYRWQEWVGRETKRKRHVARLRAFSKPWFTRAAIAKQQAAVDRWLDYALGVRAEKASMN
tara:strand:- start:33 stop:362 length:330 start_codon:yes stop_codon:yes gene_type:complete